MRLVEYTKSKSAISHKVNPMSTMLNVPKTSRGFTLIEVMIVVAIIGILAAIAYPSYQGYIERGNRADMMSEMHNIASEIQARKLAQGSYSAISAKVKTDFAKAYPIQGSALYNIAISPDPLTSEWKITATPRPSTQMVGDGALSLNYQGIKCRAIDGTDVCGTANEWN